MGVLQLEAIGPIYPQIGKMIQYPKPLCPGDTIAITAPSSGVQNERLARLDTVIAHLRSQGYNVLEGECVRGNWKGASAPARERAEELMRFLCDDNVSAIIPPTGGDLAIETLPLLDFTKLSSVRPKWVLGFSDICTILLPLTILLGWASAHGASLMCFPPDQIDSFASNTLNILQTRSNGEIFQHSSEHYKYANYFTTPVSYISNVTKWKTLGSDPDAQVSIKGRLIGGCLSRISCLVGTRYGDIPAFVSQNQTDGVILYLENGGLSPLALMRTMTSIKMSGWLDSLAGVLVGRNNPQDGLRHPQGWAADELSFLDVWNASLGGLKCPVLIDVDLGHTTPQLTLINGALGEVTVANGSTQITQKLA